MRGEGLFYSWLAHFSWEALQILHETEELVNRTQVPRSGFVYQLPYRHAELWNATLPLHKDARIELLVNDSHPPL
jgi:hypothetical protein